MDPKSVRVDVWGLCPFRSPCSPGEESRIPEASSPPHQVLGPCLFAGCGLYKITKVENGKIVDGMCSIRFLGEVMNSVAGSLEQLVKLEVGKKLGEEVTFSTESKPS